MTDCNGCGRDEYVEKLEAEIVQLKEFNAKLAADVQAKKQRIDQLTWKSPEALKVDFDTFAASNLAAFRSSMSESLVLIERIREAFEGVLDAGVDIALREVVEHADEPEPTVHEIELEPTDLEIELEEFVAERRKQDRGYSVVKKPETTQVFKSFDEIFRDVEGAPFWGIPLKGVGGVFFRSLTTGRMGELLMSATTQFESPNFVDVPMGDLVFFVDPEPHNFTPNRAGTRWSLQWAEKVQRYVLVSEGREEHNGEMYVDDDPDFERCILWVYSPKERRVVSSNVRSFGRLDVSL